MLVMLLDGGKWFRLELAGIFNETDRISTDRGGVNGQVQANWEAD